MAEYLIGDIVVFEGNRYLLVSALNEPTFVLQSKNPDAPHITVAQSQCAKSDATDEMIYWRGRAEYAERHLRWDREAKKNKDAT